MKCIHVRQCCYVWKKREAEVSVLFFSCWVTNDHKCSGLKEHKFISSQTQHSMTRLILCSPKAKAKATVS